MTWARFASRDLRTLLAQLRRWLPLATFAAVVAYQLVNFSLIRNVSAALDLFMDIIAFGVLGPVVIWFTLRWISDQVDERERVLVEKESVEEERQRAMQAAREQERLLAAVCSNSADAIITLDNDGIIKTWNRGAEMMFGYTSEEATGKHFAILLPKDVAARGEIAWLHQQIQANGFVRNYQTERVTKDGHRVMVELTRTALYDERGDIAGYSAIMRDITARVQSEQAIQQLNLELETKVAERTSQLAKATDELRRRNSELEEANEKLKELDQLKSDFVSMVSHELRAPLTNINGSLELLLEGDLPCYDRGHREMLQIVREQSMRLTRLVQGILNVSRIEAGQLVLQPQAFDILALIERVCNAWETRGASNPLVRPRARNLPSVWADRDRTEEVLHNLIDNAIKYSSEGMPVELGAESNGELIVVSVADRGIGIPEDQVGKIFEKFHRVDRRDSMEKYGHGLGLFICRSLVEAQGGEIWVESTLGEGSNFRFSLPLAGRVDVDATSRQTTGGRK
ncbi:MAG: PAS domain-containing sensor histidine kinase [Chloroflexi bacterium]|nr:PAS domain-containing sensor histidine kinase [Chloroflexota bacterium]